jgi:hypothetical protein
MDFYASKSTLRNWPPRPSNSADRLIFPPLKTEKGKVHSGGAHDGIRHTRVDVCALYPQEAVCISRREMNGRSEPRCIAVRGHYWPITQSFSAMQLSRRQAANKQHYTGREWEGRGPPRFFTCPDTLFKELWPPKAIFSWSPRTRPLHSSAPQLKQLVLSRICAAKVSRLIGKSTRFFIPGIY